MLGEMTVRSVPGEPLDAILTIEDVDLSSTTSMVRVAPPGTYLREGVAWPEQVQDLKLKRDASADNNVTVRVVGSETLGTEIFPDMNYNRKKISRIGNPFCTPKTVIFRSRPTCRAAR